jgi:hypothetical protein
MILNETRYPCFHDDSSVEFKDNPRILTFKPFDDADYWYIEVLYMHKKNLLGERVLHDFNSQIPNDVLEKIKTDSTTFLIVVSVEPVLFIIYNLYKFINEHNIPANKVLCMTELIDINIEVDKVSKEFNLDKIRTFLMSTDECWMFHQTRKNKEVFADYHPLEKKQYSKSFLNFNRRWRPHRPLFVSLLLCHNLLNRGFVSLGDVGEGDVDWKSTFNSIIKLVDTDTKQLLIKNQTAITNLPRLYLDLDDLTVNPIRLTDSNHTNKLYENSYFSLVSETCFFDDVGRFLTEKTFKPIVYQHPFVLIAPHGSLEFLRELGYKTFHPFIDETYDTIVDHNERMKMILKEVERLANLTEEELFKFIDQVKPITKYNYVKLRQKRLENFLIELG